MKRKVEISIVPEELYNTKTVVGFNVFDNRMSEVLYEFLMFLNSCNKKDYKIVYKTRSMDNIFNIERFDIFSPECRLLIKVKYGI